MGYPVAYRKGAFRPSPSPASRPALQSIEGGRVTRGPVKKFAGQTLEKRAFGKLERRVAGRTAATALARSAGLRLGARLAARAIPYLGAALLAYDLWQLLRDQAMMPSVDMTAFGYTLCAGSCPGPPKGLTTQAVCPPLVSCATAQALNPGLGASGRPTIFGTFKDMPTGPFQTRVDTWTRPATDPLPNGYRARWSFMRLNTPGAMTENVAFPSQGGTAGFSVASPGIGTPLTWVPPVGNPSPTPFVWAEPGFGPHPGDVPSDYPSHIPPPRWLLPHLPINTWPQWREGGNAPPRVDPRPSPAPRVEFVGAVNVDGSTAPAPSPSSPGRTKPPNPRAKERKLNAQGAVATAFARGLSAYTETSDVIDAIYKALPKKLRNRLRKEGKAKNPYLRAKAIYDHIDEIDWQQAAFNVITNEHQDRTYGRVFRDARRGSVELGLGQEHRKISYGANEGALQQSGVGIHFHGAH